MLVLPIPDLIRLFRLTNEFPSLLSTPTFQSWGEFNISHHKTGRSIRWLKGQTVFLQLQSHASVQVGTDLGRGGGGGAGGVWLLWGVGAFTCKHTDSWLVCFSTCQPGAVLSLALGF